MGKTGLLAFLLLLGAVPAAQAAELILFETASCAWCIKWQREVGLRYPGTRAAQVMPLRRVDLLKPVPRDVAGLPVGAMPTFVLRQCGREVGRIVGYSTAAVFWNKLEELAGELGAEDC